MIVKLVILVVLFEVLVLSPVHTQLSIDDCEAAALTESGVVCGKLRPDASGEKYASFRGMPYAKQPLEELRFQELQPLEPFIEVFNATEDGPVCPQVDNFFGPMMILQNIAEDCIRINVHVPARALPKIGDYENRTLLPILFFIHGGSFEFGAGNGDFHGPEYLVTKDVILVTFNYRLNFFGFLSLNTSSVPGNNGLRDAITALNWVQRNAKFFGGDPDEVTLGGYSAGAAMTQLLSISPAVKGKGLFKRVMSFSGMAIGNFFSYSPKYAKIARVLFLQALEIDPTEDPEEIHQKLIIAPIDDLLNAFQQVKGKLKGSIVFSPVIEPFTGIIPDDPDGLLEDGSGKEYPTLIGFNSNECQAQIKEATEVLSHMYPIAIVPINLLFDTDPSLIPVLIIRLVSEYFNGSMTDASLSQFIPYCSASLYVYPIMRTARKRLENDANPTYIYKFGYHGQNSVVKKAWNIDFRGACHTEDISYFFRFNNMLGEIDGYELEKSDPDSRMREWMTTLISNFVKTGNPASLNGNGTLDGQPVWQQTDEDLQYQRIYTPMTFDFRPPSTSVKRITKYFDDVYKIAKGTQEYEYSS